MMSYKKAQEQFQKMFDQYVPDCGKCETLGGEIIRAFAKLNYRWYNDGDKFYEGYGVETCGSVAIFLMNNGFNLALKDMMYRNDKDYEKGLKKLLVEIIGCLTLNPHAFTIDNNTDSVQYYYRDADNQWGEEEEDDWDDDYEDEYYSN